MDINQTDKDGWTALIQASYSGQYDIVEYLLDNGSDINAQSKTGDTALMMACVGRHEKVAKLLIDSGADFSIKNNYGRTAMTDARQSGMHDLCDYMLKKQKLNP